jgi:hypothetical protein
MSISNLEKLFSDSEKLISDLGMLISRSEMLISAAERSFSGAAPYRFSPEISSSGLVLGPPHKRYSSPRIAAHHELKARLGSEPTPASPGWFQGIGRSWR